MENSNREDRPRSGFVVDVGTPERSSASRIAFGAWLMVAGVLLLLEAAGTLHGVGLWHLWPLLLVALGVARMVAGPDRCGRRGGSWLLLVGIWFTVAEFTPYGLGDTWPLLLVAFGLHIVWDAFAGRSRRLRAATETPHA